MREGLSAFLLLSLSLLRKHVFFLLRFCTFLNAVSHPFTSLHTCFYLMANATLPVVVRPYDSAMIIPFLCLL